MVIGIKDYFGSGRIPQPPKADERTITVVKDGLLDLPGFYRAHVRAGETITLPTEAAALAEQLGWCLRMSGGPPVVQIR